MTHTPLPDELLIDAALLGVFDPRELLNPDSTGYQHELALLAALSVEVPFGGAWLWALSDDARRTGLALLPPPGPERTARLTRTRPRDKDETALALRDLLAPKPAPDLRQLLGPRASAAMSDARLIGLFKMLELAGSAGTVLPKWAASGEIRRRLQHAINERRARKASRAVLPDQFRGRRNELAALRNFATMGSLPERDQGPVRRLGNADATLGGVPAMLVSGIGGTGKSALIERLRRDLGRGDKVVLGHFDLDRAALRQGDQVALAQELLRQIGFALPALDADIAALRLHIRNATALSQERVDIEGAASAIFGALSGLRDLLARDLPGARVLVIVIDTFEEAQVLGPERVAQIADWLRTLQDHAGFAALRVILSGRSADLLAGMPGHDLSLMAVVELNELGPRAGRAKLRDMFRRLGIAHEDLIPDLIAQFGSNPLVIEILAVYCRDNDRARIAGLLGDDNPKARAGFDAEMRQRFLYTRILDRIADGELRALANPGLVLRRITPEQIAGLLAAPCGLAMPMDPAHAQDLFARLASQVWLVRRPDAGLDALEHLPELRRQMLPQVLADPKARQVARAAVDWFDTGPGAGEAGAEFDKLYYALLAGDKALRDDPEWLRDFALHLGTAVGDLPADAQAQLREAQGLLLYAEEITRLNGPARDRAIKRRREAQSIQGLESSITSERVMFSPPGSQTEAIEPLYPFELAQSMFALGEFAELAEAALPLARQLFDSILDGADGPGSEPMQHPAYLAALATLAPEREPSQAFTKELGDWLEASGHLEALQKAAGPTFPGALDHASLEVALMLLQVTGHGQTPAGRATHQALQALHPPANPSQSLMQWRVLLSHAALDGKTASTALPVMQVFAPVLVQKASRNPMKTLSISTDSKAHDIMRTLRHARGKFTLVDLSNFEKRQLSGAALHLGPGAGTQAELRPIIPGRQPEFHAPLRHILTADIAIGRLTEAIAPFAEIPWWPVELQPHTFQIGHSSTRILTLIDMLDKFGGLTAFVATLAKAEDATPRLLQLHRIMTRAESAWAESLALQ